MKWKRAGNLTCSQQNWVFITSLTSEREFEVSVSWETTLYPGKLEPMRVGLDSLYRRLTFELSNNDRTYYTRVSLFPT